MRCQNAEQQLIFIMFRSNWIHKIAIDPATFQEKCLVAVNCLSQRSRRITRGAVANQRMLHPALLTFMWEVVKGKRGRKKKKREARKTGNKQEGRLWWENSGEDEGKAWPPTITEKQL